MLISQQKSSRKTSVRQKAYWQQKLSSRPSRFEWPCGSTDGSNLSSDSCEERIEFSVRVSAQLNQFLASESATLLTTLLATFQAMLLRYTGQEDIVIGSISTDSYRETETGSPERFINPIALRTCLSASQSFREALGSVADTLQEAAEHLDYSFETLAEVRRHSSDVQTPLFQALVVLGDHASELSPTPVTETVLQEVEDCVAECDLILIISEHQGCFVLTCRYRPRFRAVFIRRMLAHLQCLLEGAMADPQLQLVDIPLLTDAERYQQLVEWNSTAIEYPRECIHQLFEAQVERTPDAIAVVFEQEQLTYQELNQRANRVAHQLQDLGIGPEALVGICVERSLDMVVGLLAILKAGGAYLPLDPAYPADRLAYMLEDSQVSVLLTQVALQDRFLESSLHLICLDSATPDLSEKHLENLKLPVRPEQLAYVIYTSGSTGRPKGVLVTHRGIPNLAAAQCRTFAVQSSSRILQFASFSFDASISEVFMAFYAGARLYLASRESLMPGPALLQLLQAAAITHVTLPPSVLAVLPSTALPDLKTIIVAGEACHGSIVAQWAQERRFFNAYGPTEFTVCATIAECKSDGICPPIGRPIDNTQLYILDQKRQLLPVGIPGELYIGGIGLTRGYLNRSDLTVEKFIPNPFGEGRLYRTGDLVRYRPDGNIQFLGRLDHQVKLRGFRIELGEIEGVLSRHEQVQHCIVIVREDTPGNKYLVAYIVAQDTDIQRIQEHLKSQLPAYMVPSAVVPLMSLPLTPNGKVDRKALPVPSQERDTATFVAPRTQTEQRLAKIWSFQLQLEEISIHDDFFELGGHSLMAVQICAGIEKEFEVTLPPTILLQASTLALLANYLNDSPKGSQSWVSLVPIQPHGTKPPLFCIHGAGAHVLMFRDLAHLVAPEQPVYALQSRALDGQELPLATIEEMAIAYLQEIQAFYPHGPYLLVGYSMGNFIALEMAYRLKNVALLALLDPPPLQRFDAPHKPPLTPKHPSRSPNRRKRLRDKLFRSVLSFHKTLGLPLLPVLRLFPALRLFNVQETNSRAAQAYVADIHYPHKITLFITEQTHNRDPDCKQGWHDIAKELDIYYVPGVHGVASPESFLRAPNVKITAMKLNTSISKAMALQKHR